MSRPMPRPRAAPAFGGLTCAATIEDCDVRGLALASRGARVLVWTVEANGALSAIDVHTKGLAFQVPQAAATCLTTDEAGRVWIGTTDGILRVWDLMFQEVITEGQHTGPVTCITRCGQWVYSAGGIGGASIFKWNTDSLAVVRKFTPVPLNFSALAADDAKVYSVARDASVQVWEPETGACLQQWAPETPALLTCLCQGAGRLWAGSEDGRITVWSKATGRPIHTLAPSHTGPVQALATVGNTVWSGGADSILRVWHADTFDLVAEQQQPPTVFAILFAGRRTFDEVWAAGGDRAMRVWNASALGGLLGGGPSGASPIPAGDQDALAAAAAARNAELERLLGEEREKALQLQLSLSQLTARADRQEREYRQETRELRRQLDGFAQHFGGATGRPASPTGRVSPSWVHREVVDLTSGGPPAAPAEITRLLGCPRGSEVDAIQRLLASEREAETLRSVVVNAPAGVEDSARIQELVEQVQELHAANLELDLLNRELILAGEQQAGKAAASRAVIERLNAKVEKMRKSLASHHGMDPDLLFIDESRGGLVRNLHRLYEQVDAARGCIESLYAGAYRAEKPLGAAAVQELTARLKDVLAQVAVDYRWVVANFVTLAEKEELGLDPELFAPDPRTVKMAPGVFRHGTLTEGPGSSARRPAKPQPTKVRKPKVPPKRSHRASPESSIRSSPSPAPARPSPPRPSRPPKATWSRRSKSTPATTTPAVVRTPPRPGKRIASSIRPRAATPDAQRMSMTGSPVRSSPEGRSTDSDARPRGLAPLPTPLPPHERH